MKYNQRYKFKSNGFFNNSLVSFTVNSQKIIRVISRWPYLFWSHQTLHRNAPASLNLSIHPLFEFDLMRHPAQTWLLHLRPVYYDNSV